ncbi:hypothetical protein ABTE52_20180, partial [Acinetobacter baumannii]
MDHLLDMGEETEAHGTAVTAGLMQAQAWRGAPVLHVRILGAGHGGRSRGGSGVDLTEAVGQEIRQADRLLADEAALRQLA